MNSSLKFLYFVSLILIFLPAFAFYLGTRSYRVFFIFVLVLFLLFIILKFKCFIRNILALVQLQTVRALLYFLVYLIISTSILAFNGVYNPIHAISYLVQFLFLYVLPSFLLSAFFVPKYFKMHNFIKFLLGAYFFIFTFGLFEFIGKVYNIDFIINIQQFLANERAFSTGFKFYVRLSSVFAEPGWLGYFIFINFPIIYKCCLSDIKFFDIKIVNLLIKKTLIILAWLNLIFTFSPIWLIVCIIQLIFVFKTTILKIICNLKAVILLIMFIALILWFLVTFVFVSDISTITRIFNTILSFKNFDVFIQVEPSLGSRIVSYINSLRLFSEHFILGVGIDNSSRMIIDMFATSPVPLTIENLCKFQEAILVGKMKYNSTILYRVLCETGIIGTILFYNFIFVNLKVLKKINNRLLNAKVLVFCNGLEGALVAIIVSSIYDSFLTPYFWFFMGIVSSVLFFYKNSLAQYNGDNNE